MSKITINDLPNEVLINIFGYIDANSILDVVLTCHSWKAVIEEFCPFQLFIGKGLNVRSLHNFLSKTTRKFNRLTIDEQLKIWRGRNAKEFIDSLKALGSKMDKMEELCLTGRLDRFFNFVEILKCFPNLKHLILISAKIDGQGQAFIPLELRNLVPKLEQLQTLKAFGSSVDLFIGILKTSNLTTFVMSGVFHFNGEENLQDLFKTQLNLKTLALDGYGYGGDLLGRALSTLDREIPFQLKHLSLKCIDLNNDFVQRLLSTQASTIESFKFVDYNELKLPLNFYDRIFSKFTNLKSLTLAMTNLPLPVRLDPLDLPDPVLGAARHHSAKFAESSIRSLTFETCQLDGGRRVIECPHVLTALLTFIPNITDVSLKLQGTGKVLQAISNNLRKIEKLSIGFLEEIPKDLKFPKLQALSIRLFRVKNFGDWKQFLENNRQIKELTIIEFNSRVKSVHTKFVESLQSLQLDVLRFGKHIRFIEYFLDDLQNIRSVPKVLDLHRKFNCETLHREDRYPKIKEWRFHA